MTFAKFQIGSKLMEKSPKIMQSWLIIFNLMASISIVQRDLDVPSSSVPKKYDRSLNMAEFRSSSPTPLQAVLELRIYISNSYCNVIILVHVLVVRTK